jgi:hypothetical protein
MVRCFVTIWLAVVFIQSIHAQGVDTTALHKSTDTAQVNAIPPAIRLSGDTARTEFRMTKSPVGALVRSAIVPGWGQFYNESYWKLPILFGVGGYFVYEWIQNNNRFKDYEQQFDASITASNSSGNSRLKLLREFYRDQRDSYSWYLAALYLLNLLDAYIDAHLYDFDVSGGLSIRLNPFNQKQIITMQFKF